MYATAVTARKLQAAADAYNRKAKATNKPEWIPTYHSLSQIEHAIGHLNDLWDPEEKRIRRPDGKLTPQEQAFISNERKLCALDFRGYWVKHYGWIINWFQQPERFTPNVAQNIIMDVW